MNRVRHLTSPKNLNSNELLALVNVGLVRGL